MNEQEKLSYEIQAATIAPADVIVECQYVASSRERGWNKNDLVVERYLQRPSELNLPPLSAHFMIFHLNVTPLNKQPRQFMRFDGREFDGRFHDGELFIVPAGIPSQFSWTTLDDAMNFIIEPDFLRRVAEEAFDANPDHVELRSYLKTRDTQIEQIALLLKGELENDNLGGRLYAESAANLFAVHLLRNYCAFELRAREYKSGLAPARLRRAVEYIDEHLDEDLSLAELAGAVALSPHHFARMFKQATGVAPHQYTTERRIERAKQLLKQTRLPIADIALRVGCASQSHFGKLFRKLVGISPAAYRNAL